MIDEITPVAASPRLLHGPHLMRLKEDQPPPARSVSDDLQVLRDVRKTLERCITDMEQIERGYASAERRSESDSVFVSVITIRMLAAGLSELLKLERPQDHREYLPDLCQLLDCPRQPVLRQAVAHAIQVLQQTRGKFKSKELAELRVSLETLLENSVKFSLAP
jgi:hypothetical protein